MAAKKRTAIYGAGRTGIQLLGDILTTSDMELVAFFDDDPELSGQRVCDYPVFASEQIGALVLELDIHVLIFGIPSLSSQRRREILARLDGLIVKIQFIPDADETPIGVNLISRLRNVQAGDLLWGQVPALDEPLMAADVRGKSVMVTGGGGFVGSELSRQAIKNGARRLVIVDISESSLHMLDQKLKLLVARHAFDVELIPVLGDCTRQEDMERYMRDWQTDTVFHAAAYKHVPILENNPEIGVNNNVFGTWASAQAAINSEVAKFVLISTDQAARPSNIMEASKRLAEMVLQGLHVESVETHRMETAYPTKLTTVRLGNILNSAESVVSLLYGQIREHNAVELASSKTTGYFVTFPEAAQLVLQASSIALGGDIFFLDIGKSVNIYDLALRLANFSGLTLADSNNLSGDIQIEFTGVRLGQEIQEKIFIGESVSGTMHASILKVEERCRSWYEISGYLDELRASILASDGDSLREIMIRALAGYTAAESEFLKGPTVPRPSVVR